MPFIPKGEIETGSDARMWSNIVFDMVKEWTRGLPVRVHSSEPFYIEGTKYGDYGVHFGRTDSLTLDVRCNIKIPDKNGVYVAQTIVGTESGCELAAGDLVGKAAKVHASLVHLNNEIDALEKTYGIRLCPINMPDDLRAALWSLRFHRIAENGKKFVEGLDEMFIPCSNEASGLSHAEFRSNLKTYKDLYILVQNIGAPLKR